MKEIFRYFNMVLGCLIVAIAYNMFVIPYNLLSFGVNGLSAILYYVNGVTPAFNILLMDLIIVCIAYFVLGKKVVKHYLYPTILVPLFVFLTKDLSSLVTIDLPEMMLVVIVAGFISGFGYSLVYKQGFSIGGVYILEEVIGKVTKFHSKLYTWILDIILVVLAWILFGHNVALYSIIVMTIAKHMITKARFGISDSKMFYIITSCDKEVKDFIIHDLKYELTVLDVKGGFSKKQNQILLTVISTNDYYRLKEGIKIIDPKAFIAITDTYDVVNRKGF